MVRRFVVGLLFSLPAFAATFPITDVVRPAYLSDVRISGTPDGTLHAAWIENTETSPGLASAWSTAFDRDGTPLGRHQLTSQAASVSGIAIASSTSETLVVWQDSDEVRGCYLAGDGSIVGESFSIAADQTPLKARPTVEASPHGFVVAWIQDERAVAVTVTGTTVGDAKTIAVPPPPTPGFSWSMNSVRIAVSDTIGVVVTDFQPRRAPGEPLSWPTPRMVRINRFGPDGEISPAELRSGYLPDVATDGRDFLAVWSDSDAVHGLVVRDNGSTTETVVFSRPTGGPEIEWNGAAYVGAWGYYLFGGIPHLSMGEISREGKVIGPLQVADTETSPYPGRIANCGGEAVVAWIEGRNAVAEFVQGTRLVTTVIPDPPAITAARCCNGMLEVCWENFGSVDEMWIEIVSTVPFQTRVHADRIEKSCGEYPLREGDVYVRVRALNASGGSGSTDRPIPPARGRPVRR